MIFNCLSDRQFFFDFYNSNYFEKKIIKTAFQKSKYLYQSEIDLSSKVDEQIGDVKFSNDGNLIATAGDEELFIWKVDDFYSNSKPQRLVTDTESINKLSFNNDASKIIYWESKFPGSKIHFFLNDVETGEIIKKIQVQSPIKDVSMNPINSSLVNLSDYKKLISFDLRTHALNYIKIKNLNTKVFFKSVHNHPFEEYLLLVTTEEKESVFNLDLRNFQIVNNYVLPVANKYYSSFARFNSRGDKILVSRKNFSPVLIDVKENYIEFEFDEFGFKNYNIPCCFAGPEDEYIISGSLDCNVVMWEIPKSSFYTERLTKKINSAKFILKGHTSYLNGVGFNNKKLMLASYAYDRKVIFWSPFSLCTDLEKNSNENKNEINSTYNNYEIFRFFLYKKSYSALEFKFDLNLNKILNKKTEDMNTEFNKNSNILSIKSLIINYKTEKKFENSNLLKQFNNYMNEDSFPDNSSIQVKNLTLLFEIKKLFQSKDLIENFISLLKFHLKLSKKTKRKLVYLNKNRPSTQKAVRLELLKKFRLIMKTMVYDLILIIKFNNELYKVSFELMEKLLGRFDRNNNLENFKPKLLDQEKSDLEEEKKHEDLNLKFCLDFENSKLNYEKYYSEENLKKLKNDDSFRQKIKRVLQN